MEALYNRVEVRAALALASQNLRAASPAAAFLRKAVAPPRGGHPQSPFADLARRRDAARDRHERVSYKRDRPSRRRARDGGGPQRRPAGSTGKTSMVCAATSAATRTAPAKYTRPAIRRLFLRPCARPILRPLTRLGHSLRSRRDSALALTTALAYLIFFLTRGLRYFGAVRREAFCCATTAADATRRSSAAGASNSSRHPPEARLHLVLGASSAVFPGKRHTNRPPLGRFVSAEPAIHGLWSGQ